VGAYTDPTGLLYLINRYYDTTTDQFLSIDPEVAATSEPYIFVGDDPLNASDSIGLLPITGTSETNSETKTIAVAVKKAQKIGNKITAVIAKTDATKLTAATILVDVSLGNQITGAMADSLNGIIAQATSNPNNSISQTTEDSITRLLTTGATDLSAVSGAVGSVMTAYNLNDDGENEPEAVVGGVVSWTTGAKLAEDATEYCSEVGFDEFAWACGIGGGIAGSGVATWVWRGIIGK
jgi:RHS repeat-associated protein